MRWSIRDQILVPLIAIQGLAVTATAITTATVAARRSERQIIDRVDGVVDVLDRARFPYTSAVLGSMRGLSGAHFIACGEDGRPVASSVPEPEGLLPALRGIPVADHLGSLGRSPTVLIDGTRHFAVRLRSSRGTGASTLLVLYPETGWRQARREAALVPLTLGFGSLGLMVAVTSWLAHRISARIRRMERQVALIAGGDFQELDLGRAPDEVRDLSRSINRMCTQLREMRRTIRRSEQTRLLAQLAAGLAHQLRNSLTGARMSVQLHAKRHPAPDGDQSLNVALRQLAMTEEQVKGLLSLGRVERRAPEVVDVGRLLDDLALLVQPTCRHANVALRREGGDERLAIHADESGVRAALLNLVLNAIEAAGPGGAVTLGASPGEREVTLEVRDDGPGPPPELEGTLFEAFVTGKPEGVGLGLALAHQVAEENGGRLSWTRSDGETRFRLAVPRAVASLKEAV